MSKQNKISVLTVVTLLVVVSVLHFFTSVHKIFYHDFFDRLYYLPIIFSAYFFGLRGGGVVALTAGALFFLHLKLHWGMYTSLEIMDKYLEIAMYLVVGVVTGTLSDLEKRHRRQTEEAYKKLSDSFEKAKESARLAAIGKVSAGVAHEIRNPLGGMKGAIEVIASEFKPDNPKHRFVKIIEKEIGRVNRIVEDFLNFAKPPKPDLAPANLNSLLRSVLDMNKKPISKKNISLNYNMDESLPITFLDTNQIKQVFLNVILNAIDSVPEGGELEMNSAKAEGFLEVMILDSGPGVDQKKTVQLFEPFFTTKPHGTGMGLAISKQIMEQHGGSISIKDRTDGKTGAVVTIKFPLIES